MARLKALQEFIIREIFKDAPTGVMRTLPNKELIDMNVQVLAQRLMQGGIDPTALKNANQVENAINMIESRPPVQQGIKSTKSAKVFDMEGKEIKDPKNIVGGKEINQQSLKENLMKTDNPFSDLVKTTEKGPKTLKEREAEILERMNRENKETAQRIRNRKLISEAIDNVSPGFVRGDKKYNAEIVAEEIANKRGLDYYDLDTKQRADIYGEAFDALTDMDNFATGGRAGFNMGGAPSIVLNPEERKIEKVFETNKVEDAIKEIIKRSIGPLDMAEIPLTEKGRLRFGFDSSGNRQLTGGLDLLGGELNIGMGSGKQGKGVGLEFRKRFDKGGMSRRQFMKIMGGIASLPFIGKFFKGAKPVAKVAEVATKSTAGQPPSYFFDLAAKIKVLGKESKVSPGERIREIDYKNYSLQEDITTGDMTIVKRKGDPDFNYEEEIMVLRKGQADEMTKGRTPPDEYEELTVRPDMDGKMKDVEDGIEPDSIQEIVEEVGQGGGNLDQRTLEEIARGRLASGGVATMLGE